MKNVAVTGCHANANSHEQVLERLRLEAKLRYALENKELSPHYQPIVAVDTGVVQAFEALLRVAAPGREFSTTKYLCPRGGTVVLA